MVFLWGTYSSLHRRFITLTFHWNIIYNICFTGKQKNRERIAKGTSGHLQYCTRISSLGIVLGPSLLSKCAVSFSPGVKSCSKMSLFDIWNTTVKYSSTNYVKKQSFLWTSGHHCKMVLALNRAQGFLLVCLGNAVTVHILYRMSSYVVHVFVSSSLVI